MLASIESLLALSASDILMAMGVVMGVGMLIWCTKHFMKQLGLAVNDRF